MSTRPTRQVRNVRLLKSEAVFDWRADGTVYVRHPQPLPSYPDRMTDCLDHWAAHAPERTFLAQRDAAGAWRRVSYAEALRKVRALGQALVNRRLNAETPIAILSGNSIEHALLAFAAMYVGVIHASVSPSYALACTDLTTLHDVLKQLDPSLVFAADGMAFERPLQQVLSSRMELVTLSPAVSLPSTPFHELLSVDPGASVEEAHARVTPDTIAKILFTSGSTSKPKGVITTQRMLCSNQEMLRSCLSFLADAPPVLCDWLPWNHVFGSNHNLGIVLYNGGTLYIDEGKPTPSGFATTVTNLRDIASTAYFNVPKGFEMLVPELRKDEGFRRHFFSRLQILFYAAAGLNPKIWDELQDLAVDACGEEILMVTGLGATESAPMALCTGAEGAAGRVGLPVPGLELKVARVDNKLEARLRGPNVTPGFWRAAKLTDAAFDEEGFYKMGDALVWADPANPQKGFLFDGRIAEDFKLSSGTWVSVGPLRAKFLTALAGLAQEVVITAPDRDYVGALIFPVRGPDAASVQSALDAFARASTGSSTRVQRALIMTQPPSLDAGELTDKGTINQKAVLRHRAALVDELYAGSPRVLEITV